MTNPAGKRTISMLVPSNYRPGGAEVKRVIDEFFQYVVDEAPDLVLKYPKIDQIKEVLGEW